MTEVSKQGKGINLILRSYLKKWATYLVILVIVSSLIISARLIFADNIVIYVQKNQSDFIQVFFPINSGYNEENSKRSTLPEEASNGVRLPLPLASFDHIRVDPANTVTDIFIKKIELRHLLGTETYYPDDLITRIKPIQMIGKLEISSEYLLVRSTGNDPAFELQINRPSLLFQFFVLSLISFLLSIAIGFGVINWRTEKKWIYERYKYNIIFNFFRDNFSALISIIIVWGVILYAVYPGFMSYDSLHALREARGIVQGMGYPTFVSYAWRVFDFLWSGPTLMMIAQNFLLLFSIGILLKKLNYGEKTIAGLIIIIALLPPLLGIMIVVWKDVSVAACFCVSIACFKSAETSSNRIILIIIGMFFIFCGTAFRVNAISGAIPLLMWLSYRRYFNGLSIARTLVSSSVIFVVILSSVHIVNNYRFPSFKRLTPNPGFNLIMSYDLIGISVFASKTLLPINDPITGKTIDIEYLKHIYEPQHINITKANDVENLITPLKDISGDIMRKTWFTAVVNNPMSYLKHRTAVFAELIGANSKPMFYPTHIGVDPNEYGIAHNPNKLTNILLKYIFISSKTVFCKPWFYYLSGFASLIFVAILKRKVDFAAMFFIFLSGIFYILPFFFITPAADLRYNLWAVTAMVITILIAGAPTSSERKPYNDFSSNPNI